MSRDHQPVVVSQQHWDTDTEAYRYTYRAVCSGCSYRSRAYPPAERHLAEIVAKTHHDYHQRVARLTAAEGSGS